VGGLYDLNDLLKLLTYIWYVLQYIVDTVTALSPTCPSLHTRDIVTSYFKRAVLLCKSILFVDVAIYIVFVQGVGSELCGDCQHGRKHNLYC